MNPIKLKAIRAAYRLRMLAYARDAVSDGNLDAARVIVSIMRRGARYNPIWSQYNEDCANQNMAV